MAVYPAAANGPPNGKQGILESLGRETDLEELRRNAVRNVGLSGKLQD